MRDPNELHASLDDVLLNTPDELLHDAARERKKWLLETPQPVDVPLPDGTTLKAVPSARAPNPVLSADEALRIGLAVRHAEHRADSLNILLTRSEADRAALALELEELRAAQE